MIVPFFNLKRSYEAYKPEMDEAIQRVLGSGWYILGKAGEVFEKAFHQFLKQDQKLSGQFLGCNSGTDALVLSLVASSIKAGDEVITVGHTAIPTITAIRSMGAIPRFVDVDTNTWLMDLTRIEGVISPKTKAIIPVHLYGNMVDIEKIQDLLIRLNRADISVIEDVAQAFGSYCGNRQAGTLGRFGAFSFYPTKNIGAYGDAGGIFSASALDGQTIAMLRNYGQRTRYEVVLQRGYNSRLDEIQAAILSVRLSKFVLENEKKNKMVELYHEHLEGLSLRFQRPTARCNPAWHLFVIRLESEDIRNKLQNHLKATGIETIIHYPIPNHQQEGHQNFDRVSLPVSEDLARSILSLPMNPYMTANEQSFVIESVQKFFKSK